MQYYLSTNIYNTFHKSITKHTFLSYNLYYVNLAI